MKLAIFDIDGTLTNTNPVDGECFLQTWKELHGISDLSTDWNSYEHSTDSGIVDEIFRLRIGRTPSKTDLETFVRHFVGALERAHSEAPTKFQAIPGASNVFKHLLENSEWKVAIATGAWKNSALFKLQKSGIPHQKIPLANAEHDFDRKEIIRKAWTDSKQSYECQEFTKVVYIGDGLWDLKAATQLNIGFIGMDCIGQGAHFPRDRVKRILNNYFNPDQLVEALNKD